ncbi:putative urea ABC transporter substrate-binding protein [Azospirillum sp. ST 5-10]|uniref:putative urea ABC transporter substrate-binding protein n=1 Tax=unclassified Azospirillum TaxID=2630922 RepID=UPI003F4A4790
MLTLPNTVKGLAAFVKGLAAAALVLAAAGPAMAAPKKEFSLAWSIYAGWMPWSYAAESGILKKWADKYGITIELTQINDYIESINQYTAGKFDGVVATNMDTLTIPSAGGVDTTALILGDYSNGNDGVVLKGGKSLKDIKGRKVNLVELSVSHYLLARALDSAGLSEKDVTVVNTSDADIVAAYAAPDVEAVVTWNPQLAEIRKAPDATMVFGSADVPGEIIDMTVVNTAVLADNPAFGKALVGAWFEVMAVMAKDDTDGLNARSAMASASGTDLAGYDAQLKTTRMHYTAAEAAAFATSAELVRTMDRVRTFSFEHGLLGEGAPSADAVGMAFPGGKTLGDPANVKLRFDPAYVTMAADGAL